MNGFHENRNGGRFDSHCFFSCDWGTSTFRLRLADRASLNVIRSVEANKGVSVVSAEQAEATDGLSLAERYTRFFGGQVEGFREYLDKGSIPPAVISGMGVSSIGWRELPYAPAPYRLDAADAVFEISRVPLPGGETMDVRFVSGVRTDRDVMRGEETELTGLYSSPQWKQAMENAVVVLPGTHTKHVRVREGSIVEFNTYMTGELFELLSTRSILRHSVNFAGLAGAERRVLEGGNRRAFSEGLQTARNEVLTRALFRVRTNTLLHDRAPNENTWYLYGLLVGSEFRDLLACNPSSPILIAASDKFGPVYREAAACYSVSERVQAIPEKEMDEAVLRAHALYLAKMR